MAAAGPQGPIPAADVVINGLPRFTFTEESLGPLTNIPGENGPNVNFREGSIQGLSSV